MIQKIKKNSTPCQYCVYKLGQYTSGEFDCSLYGRVKNINSCDDFSKRKKAS